MSQLVVLYLEVQNGKLMTASVGPVVLIKGLLTVDTTMTNHRHNLKKKTIKKNNILQLSCILTEKKHTGNLHKATYRMLVTICL